MSHSGDAYYKLFGPLYQAMSNLTLAATEDRRLFLSQDCLVPNSNINVRYELRPQVIAAPRMHQMIIGAMTYTYNKLIEDGPPRDRPLESDELPFEYDGIGSSKWYYIDVEQTPPGILTWEKLLVIFEGLLLCTFRRRQYHAVHFEVFEYTGSGDDEIRIGLGDFGTKVQAAVQ
ncbi:MAG: hypothetical protein LQ343_006564 [Gyalolechia ehrenbergii]|nr:MAG: hypothetical protein LQ343_006564 [Gyalolechia ehrenbergii]